MRDGPEASKHEFSPRLPCCRSACPGDALRKQRAASVCMSYTYASQTPHVPATTTVYELVVTFKMRNLIDAQMGQGRAFLLCRRDGGVSPRFYGRGSRCCHRRAGWHAAVDEGSECHRWIQGTSLNLKGPNGLARQLIRDIPSIAGIFDWIFGSNMMMRDPFLCRPCTTCSGCCGRTTGLQGCMPFT